VRAGLLSCGAFDSFNPRLWFDIEVRNELEDKVAILSAICEVKTASPMKIQFSLGRLLPPKSVMLIDPMRSNLFRFELPLDYRKIWLIEKAREGGDVWLFISMNLQYITLDEKSSPVRFRWENISVSDVTEKASVIKIPESEWVKLRNKMDSKELRVIEVSKETYDMLESLRERMRARTLDDAIHEALIMAENYLKEKGQ